MKVWKNVIHRRYWFSGIALVLLPCWAAFAGRRIARGDAASLQEAKAASRKAPKGEALRLNTLGVAYMNQQKSAEAQKYFEQALAADAEFAEARMNLGISLLAQQKIEPAKAALEEAASKLPENPYAWYNLGLAYKDAGDPEKAIAAFQHVE
jgi:tetratricopeptide (TPR) repeat protein